jgi:hypothetical protein
MELRFFHSAVKKKALERKDRKTSVQSVEMS